MILPHALEVLMATNRPDTLDPALIRPGRLDRKIEFALPDLAGRAHILKIHAKQMSVERDIRYDLLARLCPNSTGKSTLSVFVLQLFIVLCILIELGASQSACYCCAFYFCWMWRYSLNIFMLFTRDLGQLSDRQTAFCLSTSEFLVLPHRFR